MLHYFSVVMEFCFDDEDGEYDPPTLREIEQTIGRGLERAVDRLGFDADDVSLEAGVGTLDEAFGVGEEIIDVTPRKKNKRRSE